MILVMRCFPVPFPNVRTLEEDCESSVKNRKGALADHIAVAARAHAKKHRTKAGAPDFSEQRRGPSPTRQNGMSYTVSHERCGIWTTSTPGVALPTLRWSGGSMATVGNLIRRAIHE